MNKKFGGKNRTGKSCKMAAWRLSLTSTSSNTACTSSAAEDFGDFTQLPETNGCDVGTQTEWSFNRKNRTSKQDWIFFEPRKYLQGTKSKCAETLNTAALRRLRTYSELKEEDIHEIIKKLCSSSSHEVAAHLLSSPLRGSIIVELLNEIEFAAKECCNKESVLAQKEFCDLTDFNWHELIGELLEQQPLLADVLLAVSLPTSKIGNTNSVHKLIPVLSTVFGMLMKTRYQELSLVQKIIAMTLANEQTSQKVNCVTTMFCCLQTLC
ncbi:uncharacterized protein LOC132742510 [Ruditapes philippinarum]|uniref:uncharacterized protein LOC132742510 n=1 Tax=Ruditapes philippinarum TaxID=129788 RepID=UPI00295BDE32|nr:uncharacterized protein LOC132742510 [Ruditapes philippinarum]